MVHVAAPKQNARPSPTYIATLLSLSPDAYVVGIMAGMCSGDWRTNGRCRWYTKRHAWQDAWLRGDARSGAVTYRQIMCPRCGLRAEVTANAEGRVWTEAA